MEVHYSYRIEDFEDISIATCEADRRGRRYRVAYLLIGTAILLLPFLAAGSLYHPDWSYWPILPVAVCFIYGGLQTPRRIARKQYKNLLFPTEYKAEISESGIVTLSPTVRTELKWEAFSRRIEGKSVVALVCEAVMYLFPRRAFTEEQWQEFMRLVREHVTLE
jgi:YcxB-like protein